jgi:transposase-like protein
MDNSMTENTKLPIPFACDTLTEIIAQSAKEILAAAVKAEAQQWISERGHLLDEQGHRLVVANGYLPERQILTGIGPVSIQQPRIEDRRPAGQREKLNRRILPPYLRRTNSIDEAIPWMYLYGVSTNDMGDSLKALLGPSIEHLSPTTVSRLISKWQVEYANWNQRSLADQRYVYIWADGVYFNIRIGDDDAACILVVLGVTTEGKKEILAIADGFRESQQSWQAVLLDLKSRGLEAPKLAIGDGAMGFWAALEEVYPSTRHQRCWLHKTLNVLNYLPKNLHGQAKDKMHQITMAENRENAVKALELLVQTYQAKYPKAAECLNKDRETLLTFYDFPAEHWVHIRTTNPIESIFSTVRLRHDKTRNNGSRKACLAMVFKLGRSAERGFQRLNGSERMADVWAGVKFENGVKIQAA